MALGTFAMLELQSNHFMPRGPNQDDFKGNNLYLTGLWLSIIDPMTVGPHNNLNAAAYNSFLYSLIKGHVVPWAV